MLNVDGTIDRSGRGSDTTLGRAIWLRATGGPRAWLGADGMTVDGRLLNVAGLALPATVWLLGLVQPPRGGLTPRYLATYTALVVLLILVDQTLPSTAAPPWKRLAWLASELALAYFIVGLQGNLTRSALLYLVPASRALLMFPGWTGLVVSLTIWLPFGLNVEQSLGAEHLNELPTYLTLMLAPYIVAVVFTRATLRQSRDRQHVQTLYDQLRLAHTQLQELHRQARETAVTEERNRLAREIHDSIAHYLTVINLQLEAAEKLEGDQREQALEQVRRAHRLTQECLREVRQSVAALRAASLEELSLPRALDKLVREFTENTGLKIDLRLAVPAGMKYPPETTLALYRVAQEGLTNVQRHARATAVTLIHSVRDGEAALEVRDNGVGPDIAPRGDDGGFGLIGLRERIELLGGHLACGPALGSGFRLAVTVPLPGEPMTARARDNSTDPDAEQAAVDVLIVDDQRLLREGLRTLLELHRDIRVVGEAGDGIVAEELAEKLNPRVILMDLRMPRRDGVEATRRITTRWPDRPVLVLTTYDDDDLVFQAIDAGASGYLLKDVGSDTLAEAIRAAGRGESPLQPSIARKVLRRLRDGPPRSATPPPTKPEGAAEQLTGRETEILRLIGTGKTNREIAAHLSLTEGTVKNYTSIILAKTGLHDRTQAALYALRHGVAPT